MIVQEDDRTQISVLEPVANKRLLTILMAAVISTLIMVLQPTIASAEVFPDGDPIAVNESMTIVKGGYYQLGEGVKATMVVPNVGEPGSGDLNGDFSVTQEEAMIAMQALMGLIDLSADEIAAIDMDGDGVLTMADAVNVLLKSKLK